MTLFFHNAGPMMKYANGLLKIEDLNPEQKMTWRASRTEMFILGLRCLLASVRRG